MARRSRRGCRTSMNTRGRCDRWPMIAALSGGRPQGHLSVTSWVEGASGWQKPHALTRGGECGSRCQEKASANWLAPGTTRGVRGFRIGGASAADNAVQAPELTQRRCCLPIDPKPVGAPSERATVGGWMTARWSSVWPEPTRRQRLRRGADPEAGGRRGKTHGDRWLVSKGGVHTGARGVKRRL